MTRPRAEEAGSALKYAATRRGMNGERRQDEFHAGCSASQMVRSDAVRSPPASPVFAVPIGSMSRTWASSSAMGQCSDAARHDEQLARVEVDVAVA